MSKFGEKNNLNLGLISIILLAWAFSLNFNYTFYKMEIITHAQPASNVIVINKVIICE